MTNLQPSISARDSGHPESPNERQENYTPNTQNVTTNNTQSGAPAVQPIAKALTDTVAEPVGRTSQQLAEI